jgi:hypothetical protein
VEQRDLIRGSEATGALGKHAVLMTVAEKRTRRSAILGLVAVLAVLVGLACIRAGVTPLGAAAPSEQACLQAMTGPDSNQPDYELLSRSHAMQSWLPLGIVCSLDASNSGDTATVQRYQSWGLTYGALGALGIAVVTSTLALRRRLV